LQELSSNVAAVRKLVAGATYSDTHLWLHRFIYHTLSEFSVITVKMK